MMTITPEEIFSKARVNPSTCLFCHPNPGMQMHETEHFRLLRVNFPAVSGHIMTSSKLHYGSLGELDPEMFSELEALKEEVAMWFREQCGAVLFYEHGRAGSCHSNDAHGTQCEHFHLNCIPSDICIHSKLKAHLEKHYPVESLDRICPLFHKWGDYLYCENNEKEAIYYPVQQTKIPPHFLRTLICEELLMPEKADWQAHQVYEDFLESYNFTMPFECHLQGALR